MDGGSCDGTLSYLDGAGLSCKSTPDQGIYDAMNKGIACAQGRYLLFLNAGDVLASDYTLASLAEFIEAQNQVPDFIYGDSYEESEGGARYYKPAGNALQITRGMFTHHQAMIYRHAALERTGLRYDLRYKIASDYDFTARFLKDVRTRAKPIVYFETPLCIFESGGISQKKIGQGRIEQFLIRKRLGLVPWWKNIGIYIAQTALWALRRINSEFYWRMRSSCNRKSGSLQSGAPWHHPKTPA